MTKSSLVLRDVDLWQKLGSQNAGRVTVTLVTLDDALAAGDLVRSGATAIDGRFPVNTHGGLLAEGYLHGMNTVAEAALQVQGRAGERQASRHEVCAVTSGALMDGSALILTTDR